MFTVRGAGQGVLADFLISKFFRFQPDADVLPRTEISNGLPINRGEFKAGD
jgi:hypothetical protein